MGIIHHIDFIYKWEGTETDFFKVDSLHIADC